MANTFERKFLFSIFIANDQKEVDLATAFSTLPLLLPADKPAKENAKATFGQESLLVQNDPPVQIAPPEQIGLYYDSRNHRVIITGVANGQGLIEVTEEGQPQLVMDEIKPEEKEPKPKVLNLLMAVRAGLQIPAKSMCTWVVVPLDELAGGFGILHTEAMAGVSGTG